jgi:zinc/manganese transport system permease protein
MRELGIFDIMLPAFCECLVLVGIHSYLGLHVIRRKVIFVDLALAQVAALGTTVGFLFGMSPDSIAAILYSILFTFIAAGVFSLARLKNDRVPQEAVIGLVYAISAAIVILVIDRAPHGAEHIKEVMTGALLWVRWSDIALAAVIYSAVGLVHYLLAGRFLLISRDPEEAYRRGYRVRLWDFLFYLTFGVVISISVRTAGVLLVFVFLVVPAITATLVTDRLLWQLLIGWAMGVVVTVLGLGLSYAADLPSGPTVVAFYGAMLVVAAVALYLGRRRTLAAFARVAAGVGVAVAAVALVIFGGQALGRSPLARSPTAQDGSGPHAEVEPRDAGHDGGARDPAGVVEALGRADEAEQARIVSSLGAGGRELLARGFDAAPDDDLRLTVARHLARAHGPAAGAPLLLRLLRESELPYVRSEAAAALGALAGRDFEGYDPEAGPEANRAAIDSMERWVATLGR